MLSTVNLIRAVEFDEEFKLWFKGAYPFYHTTYSYFRGKNCQGCVNNWVIGFIVSLDQKPNCQALIEELHNKTEDAIRRNIPEINFVL